MASGQVDEEQISQAFVHWQIGETFIGYLMAKCKAQILEIFTMPF